jgi:DNA-binding MarR family transcriptional regulator
MPVLSNQTMDFGKLWLEHLKIVTKMIQKRELRPADASVLLAVISEFTPSAGCAYVSTTYLAETLGMRVSDVSASLSRLCRQMLINKKIDPRSRSVGIIVNPYLFSVGGNINRGVQWSIFKRSFE